MATAVAGGAAAPGAERGREPAWRRDLAGAAGGEGEGGRPGGRRLGPGHQPRAVRLRGSPGLGPGLSPLASRLPPQADCSAPTRRRRRQWRRAGRGGDGVGQGRTLGLAFPSRAPGAVPVGGRPLRPGPLGSLTRLPGGGLGSGPRSPTKGPRSAYAVPRPCGRSASGAGTASSSFKIWLVVGPRRLLAEREQRRRGLALSRCALNLRSSLHLGACTRAWRCRGAVT